MEIKRTFLFNSLSIPIQWIRSLVRRSIPKKSFGLKAKITLLIILNVAVVLFLSSSLDYHFAKKDQINLYLDRNLYIAKQIDVGIPDQKIMNNLPHIQQEVEEWLLSRPRSLSDTKRLEIK